MRWLIALITLAGIAAMAGPVVWHWRGHDAVIPPPPRLRAAAPAPVPALDLAPVLALAPFGRAPLPDAPAAAPAATLPDLALLGVIVRDDAARSLALISVAGKDGNFRRGDTLATGITLRAISAEYVVIDIAGSERRLGFGGGAATGDPATPGAPSPADRLLSMITYGHGTTISEQVDAASRARPKTMEEYIAHWRARISANPAQVMATIGLELVPNGYRVLENHNIGVTRAGLLAGDVVTTVNGQAVGDIARDRVLYDRVAESGLATIEVMRGSDRLVMSFPLR